MAISQNSGGVTVPGRDRIDKEEEVGGCDDEGHLGGCDN